jgi:hypothetical protein
MNSFPALTFDELVALTKGPSCRPYDVACPQCGPELGRTAYNRRRRVLRLWHPEPGFVTFHCVRCGAGGYAVDHGHPPVSRAVLEETRRKAETFDREEAAKRLAVARWLWRSRRPISGTIAERYLREARGFPGELPGTLSFLPPRGGHPPALIAAFGIPAEPEPGVLAIADTDITGVHITRLTPDGSGKDPHEPAKVMIAKSLGWPIVLAPPNDSGGLGITEGIECGLSIAATLGLGVWVAGSASRLPALAERTAYATSITIFADDDTDGMRHAAELERRLRARRLFVSIAKPPEECR